MPRLIVVKLELQLGSRIDSIATATDLTSHYRLSYCATTCCYLVSCVQATIIVELIFRPQPSSFLQLTSEQVTQQN